MDSWDGKAYRRVLVVRGQPLLVRIIQTGTPKSPRLRADVSGPRADASMRSVVRQTVGRILGTEIDLKPFYSLAARHRKLQQLTQPFVGMKPPRFPDAFEALVNGIACQQLSLTAGIRMLNRLARNFGLAVEESSLSFYAFPRPQDLANLQQHDIHNSVSTVKKPGR
ncbi:MAG: hypothetical protein ACRD2O_03740 [Terriglobia bacterium]